MNVFLAVCWAEWRKLSSRGLARGALLATIGLGAMGPIFLWLLVHSGVTFNGGDLGAQIDVSAPNGVRWSLFARNYLFVGRILLVVLAASVFAGELQAQTLRDDLVRAVPRWMVVLAKWLALCGWVVLSLLGQLLAGVVFGLVLTEWSGDVAWPDALAAVGATAAAEASIAAVCLFGAVVVRTLSGAVVVMNLVLLFEQLLVFGAWLLWSFQGTQPRILQALPSSGWAVWWDLVQGTDPTAGPWLLMAVWTVVPLVGSVIWFDRMDVP